MSADSKRIVMRRDLMGLAAMREEIGGFLSMRSLPRQAAWRTVLAIDEAVSNIIIHNNSGPALPPIEVEVRYSGDTVEVSIRDAGKKFDPCHRSLGEIGRSRHGMGLHLIRKAMDEVRYRFLSGHYNELTLVKYAR